MRRTARAGRIFAAARYGEIFVDDRHTESTDGTDARQGGWDRWTPAGAEPAQTLPGAPVTALWRPGGRAFELFMTTTDGTPATTSRTEDLPWESWSKAGHGTLAPGAAISAVWRGATGRHLDLFATAADGTVLTTFREPHVDWQEWVPVQAETKSVPGSTVTAVWREGGDTHLDLFTTAIDGTVQTTWWEAGPGWQPWFPVEERTKMVPGSTITALWRPAGRHLDLFATAADGTVQTTWWEVGPGWQPWFAVDKRPGVAGAGAAVAAVWRGWAPDHLDLLTIGPDTVRQKGIVRSAAWEPATEWQEWYAVIPDTSRAALGCHPTITAGPTGDGRYTVAWTTGADGTVQAIDISAGNDWSNWIDVRLDTGMYPGAAVAQLWRQSDRVDVFVSGIDGTVLTNSWVAPTKPTTSATMSPRRLFG